MIWRKKILARENFSFFHTVSTLWKFRNFIATVFSQKFRQINVLLKNFTINWFDGKKFAWQWICRFSTVWWAHSAEICKFSPQDFLQKKNRQINFKELYCKSIWRKFCSGGKFPKLSHCEEMESKFFISPHCEEEREGMVLNGVEYHRS